MAKATYEVITILRKTASALESSNDYQWGHMGLCNCGFLAQQISQKKKKEIHQYAMQKQGDWSEQLNDYCPASGLMMDELITLMLDAGFDSDDLKHLERLSDPVVLGRLHPGSNSLRHNVKSDVVRYLKTWADSLENCLLDRIMISESATVRTAMEVEV